MAEKEPHICKDCDRCVINFVVSGFAWFDFDFCLCKHYIVFASRRMSEWKIKPQIDLIWCMYRLQKLQYSTLVWHLRWSWCLRLCAHAIYIQCVNKYRTEHCWDFNGMHSEEDCFENKRHSYIVNEHAFGPKMIDSSIQSLRFSLFSFCLLNLIFIR